VPTADLVLAHAEVVTADDGAPGPARGPEAGRALGVLADGAVAIRAGKVVAVGPSAEVRKRFPRARRTSLEGKTLLPGLVDAHTHPVVARMREEEFALRCRGASYEEILAHGGGILASARALRETSEADLVAGLLGRLDGMLLHGTTAAEAKSGYGLTTESEITSLRAIQAAARRHPVTLVPTFLGAHALPEEYARDRAAYVREVTEKMIPAVARRRLARFCDVFVEEGAFTLDEGRTVLRAGRSFGLVPKVHADEFRDGGGAALAAEVGAVSAEHLGATGPAGIAALAAAGVVAVLLPATSLFLGLERRPDARAMIAAGVPVALATDWNPGSSPTENLGLVASLACTTLKMTPEEALLGITRNAAGACGLDGAHGRIAVGRRADLVVLDAPSYTFLPYRMGTNLVRTVYVGGRVVVDRGRVVRRRA
jgi:imidazolonepropionase